MNICAFAVHFSLSMYKYIYIYIQWSMVGRKQKVHKQNQLLFEWICVKESRSRVGVTLLIPSPVSRRITIQDPSSGSGRGVPRDRLESC